MGVESRKKSVAEPAKPALLGGTAIKPPERHGFDKIKYLIYDKETGEIFTRTPKSWFLITVFYIIYYTFLACFWYGMLRLFFITLPETEPKYQRGASIIGDSPGVGMRPLQPDATIDSSMLYLLKDAPFDEKAEDDGEGLKNKDWARRYQLFLDTYKNESNTEECADGDLRTKDGKVCKFNTATLGECARGDFGYTVQGGQGMVEPCVLLKLNKIYGWEPEPYEDEDLDVVPDDERDIMPDNVKDLVRANPNKIYLNCRGENPFDRERLEGKISYFPDQAIDFKYFPYFAAHKNYQAPLVAVKFKGLEPEVLYHVECRAWYKGVKHNVRDRLGLVHMELYLADKYEDEKK